jgi:hypothetical protein
MSKAAVKSETYLSWEVFLMGGASIIACAACWIFLTDKNVYLYPVSIAMYYLAFAVNHPHFSSSYKLLYWDFAKRIFERPAYFWAGVIVPAILFSGMILAWFSEDAAIIGHLVTAMYFFVGWHYAKQVFGCVIVTSVRRKVFYKPWERKLILTSLFATWFVSFTKSHLIEGSFRYYDITHESLNIAQWVHQAGVGLVGLSVVLVAAMHVRKYKVDQVLPSPPGVAAYFALLVWFMPVFAHSGFSYAIPFFHSLQYLCFVWVLKSNEYAFQLKNYKDKEFKIEWAKKMFFYSAGALMLGAMFFEFIPTSLDNFFMGPHPDFGTQPFLAMFLLFINIHHYFIDNVIWKSNNETVKQFLFQNPSASIFPLNSDSSNSQKSA